MDVLKIAREIYGIPERRDSELLKAFRRRLEEFLQLNHSRSFHANYLSWYLNIPEDHVEAIAKQLIAEGIAKRPDWTHYIVGIPVDWKAVHEGRATRPVWATR